MLCTTKQPKLQYDYLFCPCDEKNLYHYHNIAIENYIVIIWLLVDIVLVSFDLAVAIFPHQPLCL